MSATHSQPPEAGKGAHKPREVIALPVKFDDGLILDRKGRGVAGQDIVLTPKQAAFIIRALNRYALHAAALEEMQAVADANPHTALAHYIENWPKIRAALPVAKGVQS